MDVRGDWLVYLDYAHYLSSVITYTETGKVRVESYYFGRRKEKISLKNLDEELWSAGEAKKSADERRARKEAEKFLSDHIQIITVS